MLSKKMAVSLTSLITILVLASMPASAFDVKFDAHDISFAGDVQIERDTTVTVYVNFGKVVTLEDVAAAFPVNAIDPAGGKNARVDILNYHGAVIDVAENTIAIANREVDTRLTLAAANRIQAGKDYTITITIPDTQRPGANETFDMNDDAYRIRLFLPAEALTEADRNAGAKSNKGFHDKIFLVGDEPSAQVDRDPMPFSIALAPGTLIPAAGFAGDTFDIIITLTEQPKENKLTAKDHFAVAEGTAADAVYLGETDEPAGAAAFTEGATVPRLASGRNGMYEQYLVTITPKAVDADLVFKLLAFGDQEKYIYNEAGTDIVSSGPNMWKPPVSELDYMEKVDKLTVKIKKHVAPVKTAGLIVELDKDKVIPTGGYLVVVENTDGSAVDVPPGDQAKTPNPTERTPRQMVYNVIKRDNLPNLEAFLANGGTIDLVAPDSVIISEIMWGSDASISPNSNSQWIEIRNTSGKELKTGDKTYKLIFYAAHETLPDKSTVKDRVGTLGASGQWSLAGKGQSGRSGTDEKQGELIAVAPTQALISMQRDIDASGVAADGTMSYSWAASVPQGVNFNPAVAGIRVGSPGARPVNPSTFSMPTPEPEPAPAPVVPVAGAMDIMITEIMVDTGNGRLPQWIELTNVSGAEKSLAGWSLMITNAAADANVIGATVNINLSGTLGVGGGMDAGGTMGKSLLLVGGSARSSSNLAGSDRVVDISSQVNQRGRYTFISPMGFMAALIPPQKTGVLAYGDTAGNLGEAWELPMDDSGRSSLIRHEMDAAGMMTKGTDANGWVLASSTSLVSGPATWYGSDEDAGTPGYDAGGPLPVELSHFRPARDKATGAVVITWATQSELNNAGFFIKRSNQRDGEFQVINATMVPGAGTTSEKQTYTYTDTTAQPNIVYYYQIEDVSLDGNRQTLTRGVRLKGHVSVAGKATTLWGELKSSNE